MGVASGIALKIAAKSLLPQEEDSLEGLSMRSMNENLSKLKFIGYIEKGDKVNVRYVIRQPDTILTKISRTFLFPDNKANCLKFLTEVVEGCIHQAQFCSYKGLIETAKTIAEDMEKAKVGLENLKYTYSYDTKFCCDIDVLKHRIDTWLARSGLNRNIPVEVTGE